MSRELTASRYGVVGSDDYFRRLNGGNFMGSLMKDGRQTAYYACLRKLAETIRSTVEELYGDLRQHRGILRYIPREDRETLTKVLLGLGDVCKITSAGSGRSSECITLLSLSSSETRPKSGASDREIEQAAKLVREGSCFSRFERRELLRRAMDWGELCAAGGSVEKTLFLRMVAQGRGREFLGDVWLKLLYEEDARQFTGRCGRVICTREYIDHIETHLFGRELPSYYGGRNGDRAYGKLMTDSFAAIVREIQRDLEQGEQENDYIRDENAQRLKDAAKDLERCGVRCYAWEEKIDKLAWFVGGDPAKIRQLQQKLNELGIGQRLTEDGVYGKKTLAVWEKFLQYLERGTVTTLVWTDPLQSKQTGITVGSSKYGELHGLNNALIRNHYPYIRIDPKPNGRETAWVRGVKTNVDYPHINFDEMPNSNWLYNQIQSRYNHYPLSNESYDALKDFKNVGKKFALQGEYCWLRVLL